MPGAIELASLHEERRSVDGSCREDNLGLWRHALRPPLAVQVGPAHTAHTHQATPSIAIAVVRSITAAIATVRRRNVATVAAVAVRFQLEVLHGGVGAEREARGEAFERGLEQSGSGAVSYTVPNVERVYAYTFAPIDGVEILGPWDLCMFTRAGKGRVTKSVFACVCVKTNIARLREQHRETQHSHSHPQVPSSL